MPILNKLIFFVFQGQNDKFLETEFNLISKHPKETLPLLFLIIIADNLIADQLKTCLLYIDE